MPNNYHHLDTPDRGPQEVYYVHFCINHSCMFFNTILYSGVFKTVVPATELPPLVRCDWCNRHLASRSALELPMTDHRNGMVWKCNNCGYVISRPYDPRDADPPKCPRCGFSNWTATNIAMLFKQNLGKNYWENTP